ncbi:GNAT family N-acetyltransferase [Sedimentitalea nanhaiensis]|uniref:Acetyltransferase, GNAT family n=1 Tax=Sedimentitalea nanhaiensis TaxID=999627 RepID=A0A1I7D660_9RHOB|nr:GNAT family N-acetyltransferase [Sedimentitalea nanhaiensis]SFU07156.1 Acetyltransferase, GNAT family [Sedimentitalea nanhaiensis]
MTLTLRAYVPADCAACWALFHRAVQIGARDHYDQAQRDAWSPAPPEPTPERCQRLEQAHTLVACIQDAIAGFMTLETDGHLDMAFVAPEQMRRGIATALHGGLLDIARDHGLTHLTADASLLAQPFLTRRGWRVIGRETVRRNGIALPRFRMDLTLETTP